jgi:hypothetical protein
MRQVGDPDFAIVDEAYPYIAKRLLTDDNPRLQEALRCVCACVCVCVARACVFVCVGGDGVA